MNWFINLKTSNKLFFGFGLIIVLMAIAIVTAYQGIVEIQKRYHIAQALSELESNFNAQRAIVLTMLDTTNQTSLPPLHEEAKAITKLNDELQQKLREFAQGDSKLLFGIEEFSNLRTIYTQTRDEQVIPLILEGKNQIGRAHV